MISLLLLTCILLTEELNSSVLSVHEINTMNLMSAEDAYKIKLFKRHAMAVSRFRRCPKTRQLIEVIIGD